jgi:hypothetical protein
MEKLETDLAALRARAETLSTRHKAADAASVDAKARLQRHLLEADLDADYKARVKLESAVAACALTRDGYADAPAELQAQIADMKQKIADERAAMERKQAAETLALDLDEIERALPDYLDAGRCLADALDSVHHHFEAGQMVTFVRNGQAQVEVAAAFVMQELRSMVGAIRDGSAPIPAPKPEPVPSATLEQPPPTQRILSICHTDKNGLEGQARRLFDSPGAGCRRRREFAGQRQIDLVDAENRWLPRRVPLRGNESCEFISVCGV